MELVVTPDGGITDVEVVLVEDYDAVSLAAANVVSEVINSKRNAVLGLATGSTPLGMYKELVARYQSGQLDFSRVTTFNLDEYIGLAATNSQSYHYYMWKNFFSNVNVVAQNVFMPRGDVEDIEAECRRYEHLIACRGPIDVQILGIGTNGHIGFNEPGTPFNSTTHVITLDQETIKANARFFKSQSEVPRKAISMGINTILRARKILLLASGKTKADAVARMVEGPITEDLPATALRLHPDVIVIADREAASRLSATCPTGTRSLTKKSSAAR